ncbi:hypothetical protein FOCC_FOCC016360 [Frankliniella occidentalis]|nr:hypothetical protein FOCC_FOCC016360 [Frankliniella occidentalis]
MFELGRVGLGGAAAVRYHQLRRARRKAFKWPVCWAVLVLLYALASDLATSAQSTTAATARERTAAPVSPTAESVRVTRSPTTTVEAAGGGGGKKQTGAKGGTTTPSPPAPTLHSHPTWRPKRANCTPPAIEQFPDPLIGPSARRHGGLIIHLFLAVYTFIGLAIVCDDYFVASLDRICEELKLSPDVAGATFMAAGSSAPELATVVIGVFFAKDDIGVSGVIGSAVFNIMFVISTALIAPGSHVNVYSKGLTYSTLSLLSTVVFLVVATHLNGWKLDKKYGVILMLWYLAFISFASLYELNVFGDLNPPECPSTY